MIIVGVGCDVLVAVWDGRPPTAPGGTAEPVSYARVQHCDVVVWPDGSSKLKTIAGAALVTCCSKQERIYLALS